MNAEDFRKMADPSGMSDDDRRQAQDDADRLRNASNIAIARRHGPDGLSATIAGNIAYQILARYMGQITDGIRELVKQADGSDLNIRDSDVITGLLTAAWVITDGCAGGNATVRYAGLAIFLEKAGRLGPSVLKSIENPNHNNGGSASNENEGEDE